MNTIKKGSRGEDVKTLQRKLGLNVDGIFGPKTDEAVKKFQKSYGLTALSSTGTSVRDLRGP